MKKTLMILALFATGMCARAQVDTLFLGDREPTYYYWDTNWWDYPAVNDPVGKNISWNSHAFGGDEYCKAEIARYCYTDSSLRVIGVAAALGFDIKRLPYDHLTDTTPNSYFINNMVTEYFRLYEVDSTNDEMVLLAQGPWNSKMPIRHYMQCKVDRATYPLPVIDPYNCKPIYEVYFDSAVTVHDSFYVSFTGNNNYNKLDDYARIVLKVIQPNNIRFGDVYPVIPPECYPRPNHYRRKLHFFDQYNYDSQYYVTDTNWHTFATTSCNPNDPDYKPGIWKNWMCIFPIIDTSRIIPPPTCHTPNGLTTVYAEAGVATLMWSGGNADHWELSLCPNGCEPEAGSITQWNSLAATLQGLDTARWYEARVRAVCSHNDSIYYSDWSDSLRFYMPGSNGGGGGGGTDPTGIETTADRYTYVMPNPASGNVTVASSFRIGDVELLDLNGKSHLRTTVDGISAALDISSLPAGTYIVRITTSAGTAYKKLVVK